MTDEKDRALKLALERIANWNEHSATLSIDYGSNGVRDFYRNIAREALAEQPAQQPTNCRHCGGAADVICAGQCKEKPSQP